MRKHITVLGIVFCLFWLGCSEGQANNRFTDRMAGSAESVSGILYVMGGTTLSADLPDVGAYNPSTKIWTQKTSIPTPRSLEK